MNPLSIVYLFHQTCHCHNILTLNNSFRSIVCFANQLQKSGIEFMTTEDVLLTLTLMYKWLGYQDTAFFTDITSLPPPQLKNNFGFRA